jgi:hypothetical protein
MISSFECLMTMYHIRESCVLASERKKENSNETVYNVHRAANRNQVREVRGHDVEMTTSHWQIYF